MTEDDFKRLDVGDIVRPKGAAHAYVVTQGNVLGRVTAVRTVDMTNPPEWDLVSKANHEGEN